MGEAPGNLARTSLPEGGAGRPPGVHGMRSVHSVRAASSPRLEQADAALQLAADGTQLVHCSLHLLVQLRMAAGRHGGQTRRQV